MGKFVENLPPGMTPYTTINEFEDAYWKSGYKMPVQWVVSKFFATPEAVEYYDGINSGSSKIKLSKDEYESVEKSKELIMDSPFAYSYFIPSNTWIELLHQVPIYFSYNSEEFKALLDGVRINHKDKTIEPFDLKTTGKTVYDFIDSFLMYGYFRQCALYEQAILSEASPVKSLLDEGYKLLDFTFIVAETKLSSTNPAIIFKTTEKDRWHGIHGGQVKGKHYKGINQLLEDFRWHQKTNLWTYPREVYQNEGVITLDIF